VIDVQGELSFVRLPELQGIEIIRANRCSGYVRMLHENFLITTALEGTVEWSNRGKRYTSTAGELDLVEPGETHRLGRFHTQNISQRLLFVPPRLLRDAARECDVPESSLHLKALHEPDPRMWRKFAALHRCLEGGSTVLQRQTLFWDAMRTYMDRCLESRPGRSGTDGRERTLHRAVELIEARFGQDLRLEDLVEATGIGKFQLIRAFRARYGLPPHAYQIEVRLRRARDLLRRNLPPAQVAVEVGFADQSHLTRCFRRMVGITPAMFQRG